MGYVGMVKLVAEIDEASIRSYLGAGPTAGALGERRR